jgi:hypothetical protein
LSPNRFAKNFAAATLSRAGTIAWLRTMVIARSFGALPQNV